MEKNVQKIGKLLSVCEKDTHRGGNILFKQGLE